MKKIINYLTIILTLLFIYFTRIYIANYIYIQLGSFEVEPNNTYQTDYSFNTVNKTNNFYLKNKKDLYNALYTIVDNRIAKHNVYCSYLYKDCIDDLNNISGLDDNIELINNIVHPYNSFKSIQMKTYSIGFAQLNITYNYTDDMINQINNKISDIKSSILTNNMDIKEKIKTFHDYIIDNTKYDTEQSKQIENDPFANVTSNNAYSVLFNNIGLCGGYSDSMAIFLYDLGITNYKISNFLHVWNYVVLDNNGYHLDVTWDDPVIADGREIIDHTYFLLTDEQLLEKDNASHNYNKKLYEKSH